MMFYSSSHQMRQEYISVDLAIKEMKLIMEMKTMERKSMEAKTTGKKSIEETKVGKTEKEAEGDTEQKKVTTLPILVMEVAIEVSFQLFSS